MTTIVAPWGYQPVTQSAYPLASYYTYVAGSTTPQTSYANVLSGGVAGSANANPVVANEAGQVNLFFDVTLVYRVDVYDQYNNFVSSTDQITVAAGGTGGGTAVLTSGNQSIAGTKTVTGQFGFGAGSYAEYQTSIYNIIVGAQATANSGIQFVGSNSSTIQFGTSESGSNSTLGEIGYNYGTNTLTINTANTNVISISTSATNIVSGTLEVGGVPVVLSNATIPITNGGTGQTTATNAINALLPSQTGNAGYVLGTNGTNTSWTLQAGQVVYLLNPLIVYNYGGNYYQSGTSGVTALNIGWTNYDTVANGLPAGIQGVILEAQWSALGAGNGAAGNNSDMGFILIRNNTTKGLATMYPSVDTYVLTKANTSYINYWNQIHGSSQGSFPVRLAPQGGFNTGSFDYSIPAPTGAGGIGGASIKLIGYFL